MKTALAFLLAAAMAQPVHAGACDTLADRIRSQPTQEFGRYDWPADEQAVEIVGHNQRPFTAAEREALLAEIVPAEPYSSWVEFLTLGPDDGRDMGNSSLWEIKSAGLGYLRNDHWGSGHCWSVSFYYRNDDGKIRLVRGKDGGNVQSGGCGDESQHDQIVRYGPTVVYIHAQSGYATPTTTYRVREWRRPELVRVCDITATYTYRYVTDDSPKAGAYKAFLTAGAAPWLANYREYHDVPRKDEGFDSALQRRTIDAFTREHPAMAPALQQLRADMTPRHNRFDVPVLYDGSPAVVAITQERYQYVSLTLWLAKDGGAARVAEVGMTPEITGLKSLEILPPSPDLP